MSIYHKFFPPLAEVFRAGKPKIPNGYKLYQRDSNPKNYISPPRLSDDGTADTQHNEVWPLGLWQLLLVFSEYNAALLEYMEWDLSKGDQVAWPEVKEMIANYARIFIHDPDSMEIAPPGQDANEASAIAFRVWSEFTYYYFHGVKPTNPGTCGNSTHWLSCLVGRHGWRDEEGSVFRASMSWVDAMVRRLEELEGMEGLFNEPRISDVGRKVHARVFPPRSTPTLYDPVYPYRLTLETEGRPRLRITHKVFVKRPDLDKVAGHCGVPEAGLSEGSLAGHCVLGLLILADNLEVFDRAFKQAIDKSTPKKEKGQLADQGQEQAGETQKEQQMKIPEAFCETMLYSDGVDLQKLASRMPGYAVDLARCVRGWKLALENVGRWVKAAERCVKEAAPGLLKDLRACPVLRDPQDTVERVRLCRLLHQPPPQPQQVVEYHVELLCAGIRRLQARALRPEGLSEPLRVKLGEMMELWRYLTSQQQQQHQPV